MRGKSGDFGVRGYHTTMYALELPSWLPPEVVEKVTVSFQKILLEEIVAMMGKQKPVKHTQNLSIHSGFSIESTESNVSDASDKGLPPPLPT